MSDTAVGRYLLTAAPQRWQHDIQVDRLIFFHFAAQCYEAHERERVNAVPEP